MLKYLLFVLVSLSFTLSSKVFARVTISPFASMSSAKKVKPGASGKETETLKQRTTYGIQGSVSMYRLLKFQVSVGQSELT